MVRKQLYLEEAQDKALKRKASELGLSEAEFVRQALDAALGEGVVGSGAVRGRREVLHEIFRAADKIARSRDLPPEPYVFEREALYEEDERFSRWREDG